jgi:DNA ligase-1
MTVQLGQLVETVGRVRATSKKGEKVSLIAELFRGAGGSDAALAARFLTGTLRQGRIGIGWSAVRAALDAAAGGPATAPPFSLEGLDAAFEGLAALGGAGSSARRREALASLFRQANEAERRFLAELLLGEIRQGALDGLVLEAIARAAGVDAERLRRAAMFSESIGEVARAALQDGARGLDRFSMQVLRPVAPMLASPAEKVDEALARLGEAAFEYKLDGARIQLHRRGGQVRVFTRQLQDITDRVPEIVEWALGLDVRELVLEGETLALRADGRPQPFQVTMRRIGRSRDVERARRELPLSFSFFDCLYLGGRGPLLDAPYAERYASLTTAVPEARRVPRIVTRRCDEAEAFLGQALEAGHEGLLAKSLAGPYVAGQRGFHWLKLKRARTLDLVILAAEWGSGRRRGWLSNLHLGAREAAGGFVMLGKTFKGLTDEMLRWQTERLLAIETGRAEHVVLVRPEVVVEIAFGEVQESPRYPAGLALRFARVKAFRPDKRADEADTLATVRSIFVGQRGGESGSGASAGPAPPTT